MKGFILSIISLMITSVGICQVKIGGVTGSAPNAGAILELESSSRGFLPPRMNSTQRNAISNPALGLVIFNTTKGCIEAYDGSVWACVLLSDVTANNTGSIGSSFTTPHGSSTVAFSTNGTCPDKLISAGYTAITCTGSVTVGGNTYNLVHINGQCWLNTNSKEFPSSYAGYTTTSWLAYGINDIGQWGFRSAVTTGASGWNATELNAGEGYLYQWSAAMNGSTSERAQGSCPAGYHVPSDCEWKFLEHGLGMTVANQNISSNGYRTTGSVGSQLSLLANGGTGSNSTGFTALLNGRRDGSNGTFVNQASFGNFWTSSSSGSNDTRAWRRQLSAASDGVQRQPQLKYHAFSLRCLKD